MVVNVAGAATTSLVAMLKRWRLARSSAATEAKGKAAVAGAGTGTAAAGATWVDMEEATERTALIAGQGQDQGQTRLYSKGSKSRRLGLSFGRTAGGEKKEHVMFDAGLIDADMKEDQAQMDVSLPVS